jgi:hypothetical protein
MLARQIQELNYCSMQSTYPPWLFSKSSGRACYRNELRKHLSSTYLLAFLSSYMGRRNKPTSIVTINWLSPLTSHNNRNFFYVHACKRKGCIVDVIIIPTNLYNFCIALDFSVLVPGMCVITSNKSDGNSNTWMHSSQKSKRITIYK